MSASPQITQLLVEWSEGGTQALDALLPLVYGELRRMASLHMRQERDGHTLQTTGLVHEAFMRLVDQSGVRWQSRNHFFSIASQLMRRILVDAARARLADKRGGTLEKLSLDALSDKVADASPENRSDHLSDHAPGDAAADFGADQILSSGWQVSYAQVVDIDGVLGRLEKLDARQARIVELRFFGGLTVEETASVLDISNATVKRDWSMARAWLSRELAAARP
jgi:RNA polymerase sigma factor (TIGR02999 family)